MFICVGMETGRVEGGGRQVNVGIEGTDVTVMALVARVYNYSALYYIT